MSSKISVQINKGDEYGLLTVVKELPRMSPDKNGQRHRRFLLSCECGGENRVAMTNLRSGRVISCGCEQRRRSKITGKGHQAYKHGQSGLSKYARYRNLESRAESEGTSLSADITFDSLAAIKVPRGRAIQRLDISKPYSLDNLVVMPSGYLKNSERQAYVIDGVAYKTLQQAADHYGCSREWIRQCFAAEKTGYKKEPYFKHFGKGLSAA